MTDAMPVGERRQLAPPVVDTGALGWTRKNLFSSWGNSLTTIVLALLAVVAPDTRELIARTGELLISNPGPFGVVFGRWALIDV